MEGYERYAIYYAPDEGALADFTAGWLGWDAARWCHAPHPELPGLPLPVAELTATPRKYGFHGTVKPPFRLAPGTDTDQLHWAVEALCDQLQPVTPCPGWRCTVWAALALTPEGDTAPLGELAATVVQALDAFRAPPSEAEIARRRPDRLSERQRQHLADWGYPYVMDEFRFHLTLTGDLDETHAVRTEAALAPALTPLLPQPFVIDSLCLFGEAADGHFRLLHRYALTD